jgi:hypothetical protein
MPEKCNGVIAGFFFIKRSLQIIGAGGRNIVAMCG